MHDARDDESWEPPKQERFRREAANITFTEAETAPSAFDRAAPALMGVIAGGGLAIVAWLWLSWFGGG